VYQERDLPSGHLDAARLAVLADMLEEAGCSDAEVLAGLARRRPLLAGLARRRDSEVHARGGTAPAHGHFRPALSFPPGA
jgi:hypothetical protein